ncbi:glycoside hydrolase family 28 protein [Chryseobacterium artocarpi]|uniref:glycoside hydrolase family 28 protein n=1 Tax=Chryseobacterium artocarpi TaxID=1414727 RepID=UPI001E3F8B0E|nr:glycoside hydrolase family 28 protein [Chryseobacterium artocarpi]
MKSQRNKVKLNKEFVKTPFSNLTIKSPNFSSAKNFNIIDYGAVPNDKEKNSEAIKNAINEASLVGGNVIIPKGEWYTKKIHLKSNVNLHVSEEATLLFSPDPNDYLPAVFTTWEGLECYNYSPLIYAFDAQNVAITGKGTIKADNSEWSKWFSRPPAHMESIKLLYNWAQERVPVEQRNMVNGNSNLRPQFIQFNRCKNVLIEDINIRNSPFWTVHLYLSKNVVVRRIDVNAHGHNNDGIDPEMSQNILIENCVFDQGDDAIAIKSGRNPEGWRLKKPSKNIVIRNCLVKDGHQLVAIGSELSGGIENIYIENCKVSDTNTKLMHLLFIKTNERMGGYVKNVYFQNVQANTISQGILGIDTDVLYQWRKLVPTVVRKLTPITDVFLTDVRASSAKFVVKINGNDELPVKNIWMKNITLEKSAEERVQIKNVKNFKLENSFENL